MKTPLIRCYYSRTSLTTRMYPTRLSHVHFSTETQPQSAKKEKKEFPKKAEEESTKEKKEFPKKADEESKKEKKEFPKKVEEDSKKEKKEFPKKVEEDSKKEKKEKPKSDEPMEAPKIKIAPLENNSPIDPKIQQLATDLSQLNMLEMLQFARAMSKILGVPYESILSMGAPQQVQVLAPTTAAPSTPAESKVEPPPPPKEKTTWALKLVKMDEGTKYKVLKEIRALKPGMKIDESKKYIENLPQILIEDAKADELAKWEEKLKPVGAYLERV